MLATRAPYRLAPAEGLEVVASNEPPASALAASEPPARQPLAHELGVAPQTVGRLGEGQLVIH